MKILNKDIDINLENINDLERIMITLDKFSKDVQNVKYYKDLSKINKSSKSEQLKLQKAEEIGIENVMLNLRSVFDLSKQFIIDVTKNDEDILNQVGDNLMLVINTATKIYTELTQEVARITNINKMNDIN